MKGPTKYGENDIPIFTKDSTFREGEAVYIHLSTDYTDYEGRLHKHEFTEMSYILSGEAEHEIDGIRYRVCRGDVVAIRPGVAHTFHPIDCGEPFVAYDLMFSEELLSGVGGELGDMCASLFYPCDGECSDLHLDSSSYAVFGDIFHKIHLEYRTRAKGYSDIIRAYTVELIVKLFRRLEEENAGKLSARQRAAVLDTAHFLEENFRDHVTLDALSARMYFSKDYLNRLFKEVMGMPVGAYLQKLRLDEACRLLRSTDKTVAEIAELSGFGDVKAFYTVFKRVMKITPGEYRNG